MAYTIERTFVRPDTSTAWPWENFPVDKTAELTALRDTYNVTRTESFSADGLTATYTESCESAEKYADYFYQVKPIWAAGNLIAEENATGVTDSTTASNGVTINISVVENT